MEQPEPITLAEYLFRRSESLGSLSRRTGIHIATLGLIKNGHSRPRLDLAQAILRACESEPVDGYCVTVDTLLEPWELNHPEQVNDEQRAASQG